jgi:sugar phosphate permease
VGGIFVPLVGWSLVHFGWRATAFGSGVLAIAAGLPLAMVIRRRPEDHGETVDGISMPTSKAADSGDQPVSNTRDFTAREALRTPAFWLLSLGHGFALLVVGAVNVHAIAHMTESLAYTVGGAALVITLVTLFQIGGVMVGWAIGDRFEKRMIAAACMLMHGLGLLSLTYATSTPWVVAFAALHGVAWGLRGPFMHAIRADYFGRSAIGMILGLSFMIIVIGQAGGPMIAGLAADITGNYRTGFTLLALLAGLGSMFFVLAKRPAPPLRSPA